MKEDVDEQAILARSDCRGPKRFREEIDVGLLVLADLSDAAADVGGETGLLEGLSTKLGKAAVVERVLEMLEGEGVLEDLRLGGVGALDEGGVCHGRLGDGEEDEGGEERQDLHDGKSIKEWLKIKDSCEEGGRSGVDKQHCKLRSNLGDIYTAREYVRSAHSWTSICGLSGHCHKSANPRSARHLPSQFSKCQTKSEWVRFRTND